MMINMIISQHCSYNLSFWQMLSQPALLDISLA